MLRAPLWRLGGERAQGLDKPRVREGLPYPRENSVPIQGGQEWTKRGHQACPLREDSYYGRGREWLQSGTSAVRT